jgi:hypothetical protein
MVYKEPIFMSRGTTKRATVSASAHLLKSAANLVLFDTASTNDRYVLAGKLLTSCLLPTWNYSFRTACMTDVTACTSEQRTPLARCCLERLNTCCWLHTSTVLLTRLCSTKNSAPKIPAHNTAQIKMSASKEVVVLGPDPGNNETLIGSLIYKVTWCEQDN